MNLTGPPTVAGASTRERLEAACARLRRYGILAAGEIDAAPTEARDRLRGAILARLPSAACSFVFWTGADASAFDVDGELARPLTLHHSGDAVAPAVRAALAEQGLTVVDGVEPMTVLVTAGVRADVPPPR